MCRFSHEKYFNTAEIHDTLDKSSLEIAEAVSKELEIHVACN